MFVATGQSGLPGALMAYQYVREPLTAEEANRLANACEAPIKQLIVWT